MSQYNKKTITYKYHVQKKLFETDGIIDLIKMSFKSTPPVWFTEFQKQQQAFNEMILQAVKDLKQSLNRKIDDVKDSINKRLDNIVKLNNLKE